MWSVISIGLLFPIIREYLTAITAMTLTSREVVLHYPLRHESIGFPEISGASVQDIVAYGFRHPFVLISLKRGRMREIKGLGKDAVELCGMLNQLLKDAASSPATMEE